MAQKFLRRDSSRYSKLGKRRKKKQVWRKPTGRDNKMREKRKGYPAVVSIGYRGAKKLRDTLEGKKKILVNNIKDLNKIGKEEIALITNVGKKKRIEITEKAKEMKIKIYNLNAESFIKKVKGKKSKENKK